MAYRGVLDDVRTALSGGVPERLPVFAMSQVFDAVSAGHTFEKAENDKQLLPGRRSRRCGSRTCAARAGCVSCWRHWRP